MVVMQRLLLALPGHACKTYLASQFEPS